MLFDRNKLLTDYVPIVLQSEKAYITSVRDNELYLNAL